MGRFPSAFRLDFVATCRVSHEHYNLFGIIAEWITQNEKKNFLF
jgi:hypothetical protein